MSEEEKRICFYHRDLDGYCSGAIVATHFGWEIELVSINYNDPFPWGKVDEETEVWMVDFCLQPWLDMLKLRDACKRLVWVDHHRSAIKEYEAWRVLAPHQEEVDGLRQEGLAGCELTWDFIDPMNGAKDDLHLVDGRPPAVHLLGRYDVWAWKDVEGALEFQMGMRAMERMSPEETQKPGGEERRDTWDLLLLNVTAGRGVFHSKQLVEDIIQDGTAILKYQKKQYGTEARGSCFAAEIDGVPVVAANRGFTNSQFFDDVVADWPDARAVMTFQYRKGCWNVSLYQIEGRDTPDLGAIAKAHGGGGHPGAAGFQVYKDQELPFELPMKEKGE